MTRPSIRPDTAQAARDLPQGFLWGTVSSAYQYEGATQEDGRGPSIWDTFAQTQGKINRGDTGDVACDGYHRFASDLDLMRDLGMTAHRFSIAWPRVQPGGRGPVNQKGLDYYRRLIDGIEARGMVPLPTLYHWDLPQELEDEGGWRSRETSQRFAEYANLVVEQLGGRVARWTTLNEPRCASWLGHGLGIHAPGRRNTQEAVSAAHHLLLAHGLGAQAIRAADPAAEVGIVLDLNPVFPATDSAEDAAAAVRVDGVTIRFFLEPVLRGQYPKDITDWFSMPTNLDFIHPGDLDTIANPIDFLGVNFYYRTEVRSVTTESELQEADFGFVGAASQVKPGARVSAQNWPVSPQSLTQILKRLRDDYVGGLPILITETGTALDDYVGPDGHIRDYERIDYIADHIHAVADAVQAGVNVQGFILWSLLDNLEWHEGYSRRFGLYYTDYRTQERIPKESASWFRDFLTSF